MQNLYYEKHVHDDPAFPFYFHHRTQALPFFPDQFHWHESIEVLYMLEGCCTVAGGRETITAHAGDVVVINSNELHTIYTETGHGVYHCLIVDKTFCDELSLDLSEMWFEPLSRSPELDRLFAAIAEETQRRPPLYKLNVRACAQQLLVYLYRHCLVENPSVHAPEANHKTALVKAVIAYLRAHFREEISMDQIGAALGFSKYYLCHAFREVTGSTVVDTLNSIRCAYALQMLSTGRYTVSECAEQCGFSTLSYFSRTYRRYRGCAPSEERRRALPGR